MLSSPRGKSAGCDAPRETTRTRYDAQSRRLGRGAFGLTGPPLRPKPAPPLLSPQQPQSSKGIATWRAGGYSQRSAMQGADRQGRRLGSRRSRPLLLPRSNQQCAAVAASSNKTRNPQSSNAMGSSDRSRKSRRGWDPESPGAEEEGAGVASED